MLVGDKLHPYVTSQMSEDIEKVRIDYQSDQLGHQIANMEHLLQPLNLDKNGWKCKHRGGVIWIGSPAHKKLALTYLAYGNEASIGTIYSCAAMIAKIPPSERVMLRRELCRGLLIFWVR